MEVCGRTGGVRCFVSVVFLVVELLSNLREVLYKSIMKLVGSLYVTCEFIVKLASLFFLRKNC